MQAKTAKHYAHVAPLYEKSFNQNLHNELMTIFEYIKKCAKQELYETVVEVSHLILKTRLEKYGYTVQVETSFLSKLLKRKHKLRISWADAEEV